MTGPELHDLYAGLPELDRIPDWLEELAARELAEYMEPGLWIAAEHLEDYKSALLDRQDAEGMHIIRRMLYYRGQNRSGNVICPMRTVSSNG